MKKRAKRKTERTREESCEMVLRSMLKDLQIQGFNFSLEEGDKLVANLKAQILNRVHCVECGADSELECICDDLNHDDYPCSEGNRI